MNRIALITGSTDGIGKQTAIGLLKAGINVILTGRNKERGNEAEIFINKNGKNEKTSTISYDQELAEKLWDFSVKNGWSGLN
jgi:short-subunit dehydrogenase